MTRSGANQPSNRAIRAEVGSADGSEAGAEVCSGETSAAGYPWISGHGAPRGATHPTPTNPTSTHPAPSLRIGRWGNVLAVRLPQRLCGLLRLQLGDSLELQVLRSGELLLTPKPRRSRLALCEALQAAADQR